MQSFKLLQLLSNRTRHIDCLIYCHNSKKKASECKALFFLVYHYISYQQKMSRGGRGGGFGRGGGGGGPQSGAMQLVSFDLLKDLGSGNLFNVNTALFPVCILKYC